MLWDKAYDINIMGDVEMGDRHKCWIQGQWYRF